MIFPYIIIDKEKFLFFKSVGNSMSLSFEFKAKLPVSIKKRKKWIVASCSLLDIHSQGSTEELAKKNLSEAISLFFTSCFERGTLDAVLKERGFELIHSVPSLQKSQVKGNYVDVPLLFHHIKQKREEECPA